MGSMRRVVITGLGTINALGNDVETSWARLLRGESGVGPITRFDTKDHVVHFAASVNLDLARHFSVPDLRKYDLFTMWALLSADEALRDADVPGRLRQHESTVDAQRRSGRRLAPVRQGS